MSDIQQPDKGKQKEMETDIVRREKPVDPAQDSTQETPQETGKNKSAEDPPRKMRWPADFPGKH